MVLWWLCRQENNSSSDNSSSVYKVKFSTYVFTVRETMTTWTFGVIGDGIEIRPSSIPGAGMGLFTSRVYAKNAVITEYCGEIISHAQARILRDQGKDTHIRALNSFHLCIDGIKQPQEGIGGASFANDARNSQKNNAVFVTRYDRNLARDRVFLKAKIPLAAGTEVFVGYGRDYWIVHGIEPAADHPGMHEQADCATNTQQQQQEEDHMDLEQPYGAGTSARSSVDSDLQYDDSFVVPELEGAAADASETPSDMPHSDHCTQQDAAKTSWQQAPQQIYAEATAIHTSERLQQQAQVPLPLEAADPGAVGLQQAAARSDTSSPVNSPARTRCPESSSPEQQHSAGSTAGLVAFGRLSISRPVPEAFQENGAVTGEALQHQHQQNQSHPAAAAQQMGASNIQPGANAAGLTAGVEATTIAAAVVDDDDDGSMGALTVTCNQQGPHHTADRPPDSMQQAHPEHAQHTCSSNRNRRSPGAKLRNAQPRQQLRSSQHKLDAAGAPLLPAAHHDGILQQHTRSTAHLRHKQAAVEDAQQLADCSTLDAGDAIDCACAEDGDARDETWSPPGRPRKHTLQLQDLAAKQPARPQRRRRPPDPNLQYDGTKQVSKPIERWW